MNFKKGMNFYFLKFMNFIMYPLQLPGYNPSCSLLWYYSYLWDSV